VSLTLTYDGTLSRVRVSVTGLPSSTSYAVVERSTDQVRWTTVRGAGALAPTPGGVVAVDDYEFAADVANHYRVRAVDAAGFDLGPTLNANPYFEANVADWTASGGTVARSTAQAHQGVASLLLTPSGAAADAETTTGYVPVTAGGTVRISAWVRCAVARTVHVLAVWSNGGSETGNTGVTVPVAANTWTLIDHAGTAPVGTVQARLAVAMHSTPPSSHLLYVDEATIVRRAAGAVFTASITPTLGGVWLKSVARPFLNRQVVVQDYGDVERTARAGVFDVIGRSFPVAVSDVRGSRRWNLTVLTSTAAEAGDIDMLLASGDPLFIHVPAGCDVPGGYVSVGDTAQRRPARRSARRLFELPCVEVAAPGPDVVGAPSNWQTVLNTYGTWADLLAAHPTWADLLELIGEPTDVVVP
jgi:hypothetical protein